MDITIFQNKWIFNNQGDIVFPTESPLHQLSVLENGDLLVSFLDFTGHNEDRCQVYRVDVKQGKIRWQIQKPPFGETYQGMYVGFTRAPDGRVDIWDYTGHHYDLNLDDGTVTFTGEITK